MARPRRAVLATLVLVTSLVTWTGVAVAAIPRAKSVPVKAWAASVCKDFSRWETVLTRLGSTGALADPTAGKAAITKFLTGAIKATDRLAKDVKAAGVPRVKNGKAIAAAFLGSVKSLRGAYASAETAAAALPTSDRAAFATAAKGIATQLQAAGTSLATTLTATASRYPASALDRSFTSTKACKAIA
jgi:hypothetical protein